MDININAVKCENRRRGWERGATEQQQFAGKGKNSGTSITRFSAYRLKGRAEGKERQRAQAAVCTGGTADIPGGRKQAQTKNLPYGFDL